MRGKRARAQVFVDLAADSIKVWVRGRGDSAGDGIEARLERDATGRVGPESLEAAARQVRAFLEKRGSLPCVAECAIPAHGVSLRRLTVPAVEREERERMLALQLERELPAASTELIWGHRLVSPSTNGVGPGAPASHAVIVAALRADLMEQHRELLVRCGVDPRMSLGVLASRRLFDRVPGLAVLVDIGRARTELLVLEDGSPVTVRSLGFGGEHVTLEIARALDVSLEVAEARKRAASPDGEVVSAIERALLDVATRVVRAIREMASVADEDGWTLCLTGGGAELEGWPRAFERASGRSLRVLRAPSVEATGLSAVNAGLARSAQAGVAPMHLGAAFQESERKAAAAARGWRPWALLAVLLLSVAVALRYLPGWSQGRGLDESLAMRRAERETLPSLDSELDFLDAVAGARVPYLEATAVLAALAPAGTVFESLSISRRGQLSLEARVPKLEMMNPFRSAIVASPWFEDVVLHEHAVSKDEKRKGVIFRLSAFLAVDPRDLPAIPAPVGTPPAGEGSATPSPEGEPASPTPAAEGASPDAPPGAAPSESVPPESVPSGTVPSESAPGASEKEALAGSSPPRDVGAPAVPSAVVESMHREEAVRSVEPGIIEDLDGAVIEIDLDGLDMAPRTDPISGGGKPDA